MKQYLPRVDEVGFSFDTRQLLLAAHVWFGLWGVRTRNKDAWNFQRGKGEMSPVLKLKVLDRVEPNPQQQSQSNPARPLNVR